MPYFKDPAGYLHFLSAEDVANGGEGFLPVGCVAITDADAQAIQNPPPTAAQLHAELVASAHAALDATDLVCLRCYKAGVTYPAEWQTYTTELRSIVNGTDKTSTTLPTQPSYPAGT